MKALTLYQPWAQLIADGKKDIETRPRSLSYRGPLAIHAGLKVDRAECVRFGYDPDTIPRGAVVAIVHMVDCVQFPHPLVTPDDYGDFTPGRYGYFLELVGKLKTPVPARGYQCLWDWLPVCDVPDVPKPGMPLDSPQSVNGLCPKGCGTELTRETSLDGYSVTEVLWCPTCRAVARYERDNQADGFK